MAIIPWCALARWRQKSCVIARGCVWRDLKLALHASDYWNWPICCNSAASGLLRLIARIFVFAQWPRTINLASRKFLGLGNAAAAWALHLVSAVLDQNSERISFYWGLFWRRSHFWLTILSQAGARSASRHGSWRELHRKFGVNDRVYKKDFSNGEVILGVLSKIMGCPL